MRRRTVAIGFLTLFASVVLAQTSPADSQAALKNLNDRCLACHGASQMSGLDVRQRDAIIHGGKRGPAVKPGNAEESLLYQAVTHQGELKMPPGSKTPLAPDELAILRNWINAGAVWPTGQIRHIAQPSWWSFKKVVPPPVPTPDSANLVVNPIDAFVLKTLEKKGI